ADVPAPAGTRVRPDPAAQRAAPAVPPRRTGGGTVLLPPWTRAPMRSFPHPAVLLAVAGAAAILTRASPSAGSFLSSASPPPLPRMVAASCPDFGYPRVTLRGPVTVGPTFDGLATSQFRAAGLGTPERTQIAAAAVQVSRGAAVTQVRLWYGASALHNV